MAVDQDTDVGAIARQHGFSVEAAREMLRAIAAGNGSMAQFSHHEFGGSGQWMSGGMIMLSDMFDAGLKARVAALCNDLATVASDEQAASRPDSPARPIDERTWWPAGLSSPNSSGGQNGVRYAYFAGSRRLAIEHDGVVTVYDTLDHAIGGVSQQQPGTGALSFASQHGRVDVDRLPVVSPGPAARQRAAPDAPLPDVFGTLKTLADLRDRGVLTDDEYAAKRSGLLKRV